MGEEIMKYKKIMLATIMLLAVLAIGAVSASEDTSDANLTVSDEAILEEASDIDEVNSSVDQIGEKDEVYHDIEIPTSVRVGDSEEYESENNKEIIYSINGYGEAEGNFTIIIDDVPYYTEPVKHDTMGSFDLRNLNLDYGTHFVQVKYDGDENYLPFNQTGYFDYYYMKLNIDDPVNIDNPQIQVVFAMDATGTMKVLIDGKQFDTFDVYDERYDEDFDPRASIGIYLSDLNLALGKHTIEVIYTGGNYPNKTLKDNFTLDYLFEVSNWDLDNNYDVYLDEEIEVGISIPEDDGNIVLTLNGKDYSVEITDDDYFSYILPELQAGENKLTFTYTHTKYPPKQVNFTVNALSRISKNFYSEMYYNAGVNNFTLIMPTTANGNLSVYESKGDELKLVKTIPVVNGKASLCIDDMQIGVHSIVAKYTGSDYAIEDEDAYFTVYPNVAYPNGIYTDSEKDYTVSVESSKDLTGNLTIVVYQSKTLIDEIDDEEYLAPGDLIAEIYNGHADEIITKNIPELETGTYFLTVRYIEGDRTICSKDYKIIVRDVDTEWEMELDIPTTIDDDEDYIDYGPNNLPDDADGLFELYIDDELVDSARKDEYSDYDFEHYFNWDGLAYGIHTWRVEFSKDSYYSPASASGQFEYIRSSSEMDDEWSIDIHSFAYNDENGCFAEIYLPDDATGNVKIKVDGETIYDGIITDFNYDYDMDAFMVTVDDLTYDWKEKSYTIQVIYDGEDYGTLDETETVEATFKYDVLIELFDEIDIGYEDSVIAEVRAPYDAEGNIIVKINNEEYFKKSISSYDLDEFDDTFQIYLYDLTSQLDYGTYDIEVIYDGEDYVSNNPKSKIETTYYFNAFIDNGRMDEQGCELDYGDVYYFEINLPDDATGTLTVIFNGKTTPLTYNESGAKYAIDAKSLKLANYTITARYTGDAKYPDKTLDYPFSVIPYFASPYEVSKEEQDSFIINVPSEMTGTLTLYKAVYNSATDDYTYTKLSSVNVKDGKASIMMPKITEDTSYKVEFTSGSYSKSAFAMVDVRENSPEITATVTPTTITVGENIQVTVKSTVNGEVFIYVDGKLSDSIVITNGAASKTLSNLAVGQHIINIKYTDSYEDEYEDFDWTGKFYSNTFYVTVKDKPAPAPAPAPAKKVVKKDVIKLTLKKVKVKRSAKKLILTATLKINGKAAKSKKVTFKFNGKKYTSKTNKKGVAKVTIKKKVLKKLKVGKNVKYQASYGKIIVKKTAKIKK